MPDDEQKVEQQPLEEQQQPVEETTKITTAPTKKEKDPKKVAQGKRLAQISKAAKEKKMRDKIAEESKIADFSINYNTLIYFGVPSIVFAGMYLYFSNRKQTENIIKFSPDKTKNNNEPKPAKKLVSLFD